MFKKIIISLFMSLMALFVIWAILGYQKYGTNITNYHLNFYAMFIRFKNDFNATNGYDFLDDLQNIKKMTEFFSKSSIMNWLEKTLESTINFKMPNDNDFFKLIINFLNILMSPLTSILYISALTIYITGSATMLLMSIIRVISCIINFIFFPIFV